MVIERRVFSRLPCYLQTDQNNRDTYISDDVLFEPERAGFVNGYIGDTSVLTDKDLERLPPVVENTAERQKYQLSLGAVLIDPDTDQRLGGVFYPDLVGQIEANGGIVDDPNRLFETPFYAWSPPIDYDKHINFTRYYWTGPGNAEVNGEYITKEPQGSKTNLYQLTANGFVAVEVDISASAPTTPAVGDLWEDANDFNRTIYQWDGLAWIGVPFFVDENFPDANSYALDDLVYVTRTGPDYNRPLLWKWSDTAGRWVAQAVVVGPLPDSPSEGMVWEDTTLLPNRVFRIYRNGAFVALTWTPGVPSGFGATGDYLYDDRNLSSIADGWSANNWWRHFEDLGPADREALLTGDQSIRPILEFWAGIESPATSVRVNRHDFPQFNVYGYDIQNDQIVASGSDSTLFQYQIGPGLDDLALGFPVTFSDTGEIVFELTLETDNVAGLLGYRYYRDSFTGYTHSIWTKATGLTEQEIDSDGLAEVPKNITANSDHDVLTIASRSRLLTHMTSVIAAQPNFVGNQFGLNNYRWSDKDTSVGATIIDCENTLLRTMATLQRADLDIPTVIRRAARDYNRVIFKFTNRLTQLWENLTISTPNDTLSVTPAEAVDAILTELFIGRGPDFPYFNSDMGTYIETQILSGNVSVIGTGPRPIFLPPSPARAGAGPTYRPGTFTDRDGVDRLRGHEGTSIPAFGDDRDLVWLELQNRFFNAVPDYYKTESSSFSARYTASNFFLKDYYGNSTPTTTARDVDGVVADYNAIPNPVLGETYFDTGRGVFAYYEGTRFFTSPALVDDVFFNRTTGEYFIFNGFGAFQIERYDRAFDFDYTTEEFRRILRREFERWAVFLEVDFVTNAEFDENDPFTWNYRSAGLEGHYQGIYRRIYNTVRPHSHPWEVVGYYIEPDWWRTQYPPTSTAPDGTPRYANTDPMWADLQAGQFSPFGGISDPRVAMIAPIPVDAQGELLDPIAAGVVNEHNLVPERRDDSWIYGDGAPIEQDFYSSPAYAFAVALLGYLMKPGLFVDTVWSELYIDVGMGGPNPLWRAPHVVHRDTLTRPSVGDLPVHLEVQPDGTVEQRLGINAWISEYVKLLGNDVTPAFGNTIRNTTISPGWRVAGFLNPDRTVLQTLSGVRIPFEDIHTNLQRSPPTRETFGSGVLVTREGTGYRVFGFDLFDPFFTIDVPVAPIAGGQTELREEFVATVGQRIYETTQFRLPQNVQDNDTAKLGVLINGLRIKPQHVTVTGPNTFEIESIVNINTGDVVTAVSLTTQSNPSTKVKQFSIEGVAFPYIDAGQGFTEQVEYGRYFDTAPDVINFMLGYGRHLEAQGWVFDDEVGPGQMRDWLYGAKQFATWVLESTSPWQPDGPQNLGDFFFSPFINVGKFQSPFGQVLNVEALQNGAYGIIDQNANPIDPEVIFTSRIGNELTLARNDDAPEMYGLRVLIAEDQHVVFLSNITKFNDLIYDPVLSLFQSTLRAEAYRSELWAGRLEANGFIVDQGNLLPNFEKQAADFVRFYDRINTLDDPVKRDQARELYGWYPNNVYTAPDGTTTQMMDAIGAEERSRFDYHRGMIHTKGSIRPLIAFSRGTCLGRDNVIVYEDWAWRWCEFGDTRRERVQFAVNKRDFRDQVQVVEFNVADNERDTVIQIPEFDRNNPDDPRWLLPPAISEEGDCCEFTFPIIPPPDFLDIEKTKISVELFDRDTDQTQIRLFNYNPSEFLFDPSAICEIDYIGELDPARYTSGSGSEYSDGLQWGPEQIGQYWWDQSRIRFLDARANIPDYNAVARDWGRLQFFRASVTIRDEIATIDSLDPYQDAIVAHGLETGDVILITGADEDAFNGSYSVTVSSPTQFEITLNYQANNTVPGGQIILNVSFIDVYEWVESPVPPEGWEEYLRQTSEEPGTPTGPAINGASTSYVTRASTDNRGRTVNFYYFWILNNSGDNPNRSKALRGDQVALRLRNPTVNSIPWFGIVDENHMLVFLGDQPVQDNYAMEVVIDETELEYHTEWLLISEGDRFIEVPEIIRNKLIDCVAGADRNGSIVPSDRLTERETFGTNEFPPQTVYQDRLAALDVMVTAINTILNRQNFNDQQNINAIFPLADEGTYWTRAEFRQEEYEGQPVFDQVGTEAIRDQRLSDERYAVDDLVLVFDSSNFDLWDGSQTETTYVVTDTGFEEAGINNYTLNISLDENSSPDLIRDIFTRVYDLLDKEHQNSIIFSLLYEMMRQTPDADWFMKTSYVTTQVFDTVDQSPFVRPSESEAVIANLLEHKPYRTKLRSSTFTYTVGQVEDMGIQINEFPDKKITLTFDRLACGSEPDAAGWDIFAWDTEIEGWDKQFNDSNPLGAPEDFSLGSQPANQVDLTYVFDSPHNPSLYEHTVMVRLNGDPIILTDFGVDVTITTSVTQVFVTLSGPLNNAYEIEVLQTSGFYQGNTPTLGPQFEDTLFQPVPSTYKHHILRMMEAGIQAPFPSMDACYLDPPESPEERIPNDMEDCVVICVRTDWTAAYRGWDTTPWDSAGWDDAPGNIGPRVFYISAGTEVEIAPGIEVLLTSQNILLSDARFAASPQPYDIARVDLNTVQLTEGVDYQIVPDAPWVVEFLPRPDLLFAADGITTSFDVSQALAGGGIQTVLKNNIIQLLGVDYNVVGNNIEFVQPAPTVVPILAYTRGTHFIGNANGFNFPTGVPGDSLNQDNTFVFINGDLVPFTDYVVDQNTATANFTTPPSVGDDVTLFSLGNDIADDSARFIINTFAGDGTTTTFNPPDANNLTAWVFVDGRYQILGIDYTVPAYGSIDFTVAPANGAVIEVRVLDPNGFIAYDQEHIVFPASGNVTDPIPGLNDAEPNRIMVFVGDHIQNAYSPISTDFTLSNGSPDEINWNNPPAPGTPITVRVIRSVTIAQSTFIGVEPNNGDEIRVVQNPLAQIGDLVTFYYNNLPLGPVGTYVLNFVPTDYDVVDQQLILDQPFLNGFVIVNYTQPRRGPNPNALLVRMTNVVDRAEVDHLTYEPTTGFEDNRHVGLRVLNTTDAQVYQWDGTNWVNMGITLVATDQVLVLQSHQIVEFDGTNFNVVFNTGDTFTTPPVLPFPAFGLGITYGGYALGQTPSAATDFPEAYQVVQFPGGC